MTEAKIYRDEGAGDIWVAASIIDVLEQYERTYDPYDDDLCYDEDFFSEYGSDETIRMWCVDELEVHHAHIPPGGRVGYDKDIGLYIEATAAEWLAHLSDEDVSEPWLVGEW